MIKHIFSISDLRETPLRDNDKGKYSYDVEDLKYCEDTLGLIRFGDIELPLAKRKNN